MTSNRPIVHRDEAHPEARQGVVVGPKVRFHLVDFNSATPNDADCPLNDACDALIDREIT